MHIKLLSLKSMSSELLCYVLSFPDLFPHYHVGLRSNTNHTTLCVAKTVCVFFNAHILFIHPAPGFILPHCAKFSKQNELTAESYNLEQWTTGERLNLRGQLAYVFFLFSLQLLVESHYFSKCFIKDGFIQISANVVNSIN